MFEEWRKHDLSLTDQQRMAMSYERKLAGEQRAQAFEAECIYAYEYLL